MYEIFIKNLASRGRINSGIKHFDDRMDFALKNLFIECGGCSFGGGLYRIHYLESSQYWTKLIETYFVNYSGRIVPFGYDWMGRQFTLDLKRRDYILMFDPATGEDMELKQDLVTFHNQDLIEQTGSILSDDLFREIMGLLNIEEVGYNDCLGYRTPLFLNGSDSNDNYETVNMEVYWDMLCQIFLKIKNLPPGTKINSIKFK